MTIRWTEEEARAFGFKKDSKGDWRHESARGGGSGGGSSVSTPRDPRAVSKPKRDVQRKAKSATKDGAKKTRVPKSQGCPRYRIFVTSYRKRDTDPDNIIPKWYIDEIVRAGLIPDDSSKYVEYIVKQVVVTKEESKTVIEVFRCP